MSDDPDSRNDLLAQRDQAEAENAELRAELLSRAEKDAEDMHRLQGRYDHLYRQFESLQTWVARGMALQPPPPIMVQGDDRALLESVMRAGDLEHARMAALVEACEATAAFIESYAPDSALARMQPTFYGVFRVYGKNARAAVNAVRPQADALLARLADLSRQIGEQNTTIGYQDAMLAEMRTTLDAAYHGLMSYACGNSAPALAEEMAAEIKRVLGKASNE